MRKFLVILTFCSFSCTPTLKIKGYETYRFNSKDCNHKLVLDKSGNFEFTYHCLDVIKLNQGTWVLSKDSIYFNSNNKTKVADVLASGYIAEMPSYGLLRSKKVILINNIMLKAK